MQSSQGFGLTSESRNRLARRLDALALRAGLLPRAPVRPAPLRAFTLIELLIVVAIIVILAAIAVPNFLRAQERALIAKDMSQMRSIGAALQMYHVDFNNWPPADSRAGAFQSHGDGNAFGNAPAAGGNWSAVPWVLYDLGYVETPETLFCPKYFRKFSGGKTIQDEEGQSWPRYHNFRYAYNASALSQFGDYVTFGDFTGPTMNNQGWILRDVFMDADLIRNDFGGEPAFEWDYPWGEGDNAGKVELMMRIDMRIMPVFGREAFTDEDVPAPVGVF